MLQSSGLPVVAQRLSDHIKNVPAKFNSLPRQELLHKPAGKWSKQEILGHLVDSAINNLKRFTDAQYLPQPYTVVRYQQDDLVRINNYQELSLNDILSLWVSLNKQIVTIIASIPADKTQYTVLTYSDGSKTLEWLMTDYVDHMEHHLKRVFG